MIGLRPARPGDAAAVAAVHVASWRQGYGRVVPAEMLAGVTLERRVPMWEALLGAHAATHPTLVAEADGGTLVGFGTVSAASAVDGFDSEVHMLFLDPAYQRRDVGRRLFRALSLVLLERGALRVMALALASDPACGFAAAMGGLEIGRAPLQVPGGSVTQVLYGCPLAAAVADPEPA